MVPVVRAAPAPRSIAFQAVAAVHKRLKGSYAVVALIAGYGLLAFRDPYGIRPLIYGTAESADLVGIVTLDSVAGLGMTLDGSAPAAQVPDRVQVVTIEGAIDGRFTLTVNGHETVQIDFDGRVWTGDPRYCESFKHP